MTREESKPPLDPRIAGLAASSTLAIQERSRERAARGLPTFRLGLGQSPFPVPESVVQALRDNAAEKEYLSVQGLAALRESVADYHRLRHGVERDAADVLVGPGSKELMFLLQVAFAGELLVPTPAWVSYVPQARIIGRSVRLVHTRAEDGFLLRPEALAEACRFSGPRILILNYPNNPTGASYGAGELQALAEVAARHGVIVLSDEIYGELHHRGEHVSIARYYPEGTILSGGLSKWCGAGGWRLGTFCFPPSLRWLLRALAAIGSETYSTTSAPVQFAAVTAFRGGPEIDAYLDDARKVLGALLTRARELLIEAGAEVVEPAGAFYLFPSFRRRRDELARRGVRDDRQLAMRLFDETGVATLPGSDFGVAAEELYLRLALVDFDGGSALEEARRGPIDDEFLRSRCAPVMTGIERIAEWLRANE